MATAACFVLIASQYGFPKQDTVSENDFAEMSNLEMEIACLTELINEQENMLLYKQE